MKVEAAVPTSKELCILVDAEENCTLLLLTGEPVIVSLVLI